MDAIVETQIDTWDSNDTEDIPNGAAANIKRIEYRQLTLAEINRFNRVSNGFIYLFGVLRRFQHCKVISRRVVGRAEETSTYSLLGFCTVNCRPTASNWFYLHSFCKYIVNKANIS